MSPISAKEYLEGHVKGAAEFLAAFKRENPTAVATVDLILGLVLVEGRTAPDWVPPWQSYSCRSDSEATRKRPLELIMHGHRVVEYVCVFKSEPNAKVQRRYHGIQQTESPAVVQMANRIIADVRRHYDESALASAKSS